MRIIIRRAAEIPHYQGVESIPPDKLKNLLTSNQQNPNIIYDFFINTNLGEEERTKNDTFVLGRQFRDNPIIGISPKNSSGSLVDRISKEIVDIFYEDQDDQENLFPEDYSKGGFFVINSSESKSTYYKKLMESYAKMAEIIGEAICA